MNFDDAMKAGGASATIIAIVGIAFKLIQSFCGRRVKSECCGYTGSAGVSVETIVVDIPPPPPPSVRASPMIAATPAPSAPQAISI